MTLDLSVYYGEDFRFFGYGLRCYLGSFGAKTVCSFTVGKACGVDAHIELCSEYGAACCECAYAGVRYRCRVAFGSHCAYNREYFHCCLLYTSPSPRD